MAVAPAPTRVSRSRHTQDGVLTIVKVLLEVVVIASFVVTFLVQPFRIPSGSMEPTLMVGDFVMVDKQSYGLAGPLDGLLPPSSVRRGDLVVFHFPVDPSRHLVKRVIGLPGDRLHLHRGQVYCNGVLLSEPYAFRTNVPLESFRDEFPSLRTLDPNVEPRWWAQLRRLVQEGEVKVPPGHYFVMGDNRNNSEDSRYWGFVPKEAVVGRPLVVYFSLQGNQVPTVPGLSSTDTLLERLYRLRAQVRVLR